MEEYTQGAAYEAAAPEQADVVDQQAEFFEREAAEGEEESQVAEGTDAEKREDAPGAEEPDARQKKAQSRNTNAALAAARRAGEMEGRRKAREELDRRFKDYEIEHPGKKGEKFKSLDDVLGYGEERKKARQKARAEMEGKTLEEVQQEEEALQAGKEAMKARKEQEKRREFLRADAANFRERFPSVDVAKLEKNASFRKFCGSRLYKEPLGDLYEDYLEFSDGAGQAALAKEQGKTARSTGSGNAGGNKAMTAEQQAALEEWNRSYPNMKMTAKEFLAR